MSSAPARKKMSKKWLVRPTDNVRVAAFAQQLGVSQIVADLLIARGYHDPEAARAFLNPALDQLHDPSLMLGMSEAVRRLQQAIDSHQPILVYGDYDVDGTTGTAVLLRALRMLGATAGYHVPHRFTEGYGIQQAALEKAVSEGYKLVVSVDCGIRAHEPLHWARAHALDIIITDHRMPNSGGRCPGSRICIAICGGPSWRSHPAQLRGKAAVSTPSRSCSSRRPRTSRITSVRFS